MLIVPVLDSQALSFCMMYLIVMCILVQVASIMQKVVVSVNEMSKGDHGSRARKGASRATKHGATRGAPPPSVVGRL